MFTNICHKIIWEGGLDGGKDKVNSREWIKTKQNKTYAEGLAKHLVHCQSLINGLFTKQNTYYLLSTV